MFYKTYILLFLLSFWSCEALQCTTNCSYSYNSSTSFIYPEKCNQIVSAGKCRANLAFLFDTQDYFFSLSSSSTSTVFASNNQRRGLLQISSQSRKVWFSHYVDIECKDKDDCARDLAIKISNELTQRKYDFSKLVNQLEEYMIGPKQIRRLNCYDSNEKGQLCAELPTQGSCVLENQIKSNKMTRSCRIASGKPEISIRMHQDSTIATFELLCHRDLCNTKGTLNAVKEILFRNNITQTPDGRLTGSTFQISFFLLLSMIFITFSHQF